MPTGYLAILPGQSEWLVLLVIGLLLFGRRLPEVGKALGKTVSDLRRGMTEFKTQINADDSLREARDSVNEIRKAVDVPRIATDPKRLIRKLTEDPTPTTASPSGPVDTRPEQPKAEDPQTEQPKSMDPPASSGGASAGG